MRKTTELFAAASAMALVATSALAQAELIGTEALDDRIEDIEEVTEEEFEEAQDEARFGFGAYPPGFSGSLSASGFLTGGNTDTFNAALGGRIRYGAGPTNLSFGVAAFYGEDDGDEDENNVFVTLDGNRYLNDRVYLFGIGFYEYDDFGALEHDLFLGAGPGVRLYNTPQLAWRVQAGPGVRWTEDQTGEEETEAAAIASSRLFYEFNDTAFFTNDTDIIYSDVGTQVINDAGINFRLTDSLATRVSYRVDYNSDPLPDYEETDNLLTFSVVYGFN